MIFAAIIIFIIGVVLLAASFDQDSIGTIVTGVVLCAIGAGMIWEAHLRMPKAIDVYRGKTTLQITYRDSIPIDSIVVFKEK